VKNGGSLQENADCADGPNQSEQMTECGKRIQASGHRLLLEDKTTGQREYHIAMGHLLCKLKEVIFHLALDPSATILPDDKEIGGVKNTNLPSLFAGVGEFERRRLIVKL
jgi:hypothetical protein